MNHQVWYQKGARCSSRVRVTTLSESSNPASMGAAWTWNSFGPGVKPVK